MSSKLKTATKRPCGLYPFVNDNVKVDRSAIHGRGLFAARRIPPDTWIGNYDGPETDNDGTHVLWIEREDGEVVGIDGRNELRFTNHSEAPNATFLGEELWSLRAISPGEEITFDYDGEVEID